MIIASQHALKVVQINCFISGQLENIFLTTEFTNVFVTDDPCGSESHPSL